MSRSQNDERTTIPAPTQSRISTKAFYAKEGRRVFVVADGETTELLPARSQQLIDHSPDGFNWGYSGSGSAQLSHALLLEVTDDEQTALRYYQDFKWDVIANLPPGVVNCRVINSRLAEGKKRETPTTTDRIRFEGRNICRDCHNKLHGPR